MYVGSLIETTNEYALAEMALNAYIDGDSSLLEAYANADMYVLSETVTKKFSFGQNGTNVTVNKRGIQYDPSEYEQHERNNQYVYDTPLNTRIEDIKKSAAKIGIDVSKLSKEELEDLALDDLAIGDHNITGRNLAVSASNMLDDYLDSNENLSRKEKKELRKSNIDITNKSIVMGKEKVFNNSVPSSNEKPSISPSKASEKIISVPNYKPPEPQQQAQSIANVVKPEEKKTQSANTTTTKAIVPTNNNTQSSNTATTNNTNQNQSAKQAEKIANVVKPEETKKAFTYNPENTPTTPKGGFKLNLKEPEVYKSDTSTTYQVPKKTEEPTKSQAENIASVVKPEEKKEEIKSEPSQSISNPPPKQPTMSQSEKQETIVKTQQQMRKVLDTSENQPKSVLSRMISSLQNLYRKWLDKKNQAKANGEDVGFFSNILRVILNCIDKLMWKIRNWSDGRKSNHYNNR